MPGHCIKLLLGDMKAQVGKENTYKTTIGKYSLHDRSNDNGIRLINFAISKNMVISSIRFPRKNIHKETWLSPGGRFSSQIDHVLIENKHKTIIKNGTIGPAKIISKSFMKQTRIKITQSYYCSN
jgi:hypothetical protein